MSIIEQKKELDKLGGVKEKKRKERGLFDFFGIKKGEKIVTAFPPGPEKYPHIGHAKALFLNYLLAKEYNGKFILRFEDTNPELVKKEFYDIMLENFSWLGVEWDELLYASDYMEDYYRFGEKLIKSGLAYVCYCSQDSIKEGRKKSVGCACRRGNSQTTKWKNFFEEKPGKAIVRLKINMAHKNSTMKDPAIFRINETEHARHGRKYRVWPTYDFQNSVMDGKFCVTHRLRSKEFEMRSELHKHIQKLLGFGITNTYEFARFNMEGVLSSGRVTREYIDKGKLIGWDDPRLTTVVALRRRGFLPEAIKEFVLSTGITKSESTVTWGDLIIRNKRILDSNAKRYFFVQDPKMIKIAGCEKKVVKVRLHPEKNLGQRTFKVEDEFYVSDNIKSGTYYRLMHLFNFRDKQFVSEKHNPKLKAKIIHWLPISDNLIDVEIFMDDGGLIKGYGESDLRNIKIGEVVQFERFGFVRLDAKEGDCYKFWFTHK